VHGLGLVWRVGDFDAAMDFLETVGYLHSDSGFYGAQELAKV
jgi:hypothetical protein